MSFYYYDDSNKCIDYKTLQVGRKKCHVLDNSAFKVNGQTSGGFAGDIQSGFGSFADSSGLFAVFGAIAAIKIVVSVFRKK